MHKDKDGLTPQYRTFCDEYVKLGCGKGAGPKAAVAAGYSEKSARAQATRLLKNVHVQAYIARLTAKTADRTEVTIERLLEQMALVAFGDPRALFDPETGELLPIHRMSREAAALLAGVDVQTTIDGDGNSVTKVARVRLRNPDKNLEMLGRHLAMFIDRLEVRKTDTRTDEQVAADVVARLAELAAAGQDVQPILDQFRTLLPADAVRRLERPDGRRVH